MANKMLIDASHPEETRVVVIRGQKVEEFDFESASRRPLRGNIYLAKVTRVEPSLQAAFIDYGGNRHGFLAFNEIHPDYYQIPMADRQALIEEDARAERDAEREEERALKRRQRSPMPARRTARDDKVASRAPIAAAAREESETADEPTVLPQLGEPPAIPEVGETSIADQAEPLAKREDAERGPGASEPDEDTGHAREDEADDIADQGQPFADPTPPTVPDPKAEPAGHDEASDPGVIALRGEADDDGDAEPAEEDLVEHVGGTDALEEAHERRPRQSRRQYKIQEVIKRRQVLLVQVVKEERGNKGAALTTYLSLAGRYSVLMPNTARGGGISRKITSAADRKRLKEIAQELDVPEGMGIILRTAGASRTKAEVKRDFEYLLRLWESVRELTLKSSAPALVYEEGSLIKRAIRDLYNKDIDEVQVAGDDGYREAKDFMRMLMPSHAKTVKPFRDTQPLFAQFGVEQQLDAMFSNQVTLRAGGYIVINPTEALVSIDVNSGRATREHNIEDTALKTNMEAAEEIARQLRLRDLAGLIVIDFIDMEEKRNNRAVEKKLKDCLKNDRARIQLGRISAFGLMEMSRQRIRTGVLESSSIPCAHCGGSGSVRATPSIALHVLRSLEEQLLRAATHNLLVKTQTEVALYILNQKRLHLRDLEMRFGIVVTVMADDTQMGAGHFALERGEAVARSEPKSGAATVQIDALMPDEEPAEAEGAAAREDEEATEGSAPSERGDAAEADGGRRKRRRRRRRGRDEREPAQETDAPAGEGEEPASNGIIEAESDDEARERAGAPRDTETEDQGGRRRRGRRGGRRGRRDRDDAEAEPSGDSAVTASDPGDEADEDRASAGLPVEAAEVEVVRNNGRGPQSDPEPAAAADEPSAESAVEPMPEAARQGPAQEPPARADPEPEPMEIVAQDDPNRPKRSGWWSRAKASFSSER